MNLAPVLAAPPLTQAHLALTLVALLAGTCAILAPKGAGLHRPAGAIFAVAIMLAAATSLGITGLNPGHFTAVHLLSILTLVNAPLALLARRRGNIRAHALGMSLNFAGLVIAGAFAFAPPRVLHAVLFGQ